MAEDDKKAPVANKAADKKDEKVEAYKGAKEGNYISGTGVTVDKDGNTVLTDQPDNQAHDGDVADEK